MALLKLFAILLALLGAAAVVMIGVACIAALAENVYGWLYDVIERRFDNGPDV